MSVGHYENFPVASWLLPRALRPAVAAIYWFARTADDFADEGNAPPAERLARLDAYRGDLGRIAAGRAPDSPVLVRLASVIAAHALPLQPFHDLLDAFSQDVVKQRYASFAEVLDYCRRSANPVGRLMLHLFGAAGADNVRRSDAICPALQLATSGRTSRSTGRRAGCTCRRTSSRASASASANLPPGASTMPGGVQCRSRSSARAGCSWPARRSAARCPAGSAGNSALVVQGGLRILEQIDRAGGDVFRHRPVLRAPDWSLMFWRAAMT